MLAHAGPPPSYPDAMSRDTWALLVERLPLNSVCALSRTNKHLHFLCSHVIWKCPAAEHCSETDSGRSVDSADVFGTEPFNMRLVTFYTDLGVVRLNRFRNRLSATRPFLLQLTQVLRVPGGFLEAYLQWDSTWLSSFFSRLPRLRCVHMFQLLVLDHHALMSGAAHAPEHLVALTLRECPNVTSSSLSNLLSSFCQLEYLDLSSTRAARDQSVLGHVAQLYSLRTLILRNVGLRDVDCNFLVGQGPRQISYLDLGWNCLSIRALIEWNDYELRRRIEPARAFQDRTRGRPSYTPDHQISYDTRRTTKQQGAMSNSRLFQPLQTYLLRMLDSNVPIEYPHGLRFAVFDHNDVLNDDVGRILGDLVFENLDIGDCRYRRSPKEEARLAQPSTPGERFDMSISQFWSSLVSLRIDVHDFVHSMVCIVGVEVSVPKDGTRLHSRPEGDLGHARSDKSLGSCGEKGPERPPILLPNLVHITLSQVPEIVRDMNSINLLTAIIDHAAAAHGSHSIPYQPGRKCLIFGIHLQSITFELQDLGIWSKPGLTDDRISSFTGDDDSDAFWEAQAQDFSFFTPSLSFESAAKSSSSFPRHEDPTHHPRRKTSQGSIDVREELSRYRQEQRSAWFEATKAQPQVDFHSHWHGEVIIRRPQLDQPIA